MVKSKLFKKIISIALSSTMIFSLLTSSVSADDNFLSLDEQSRAGINIEVLTINTPATYINILGSKNKNMIVGQSYQIKYSFSPDDSDDYVSFKSYNPNIAIVSDDGIVSAVGVGTATIRVTSTQNITNDIYVFVSDINSSNNTNYYSSEQVTSVELFDNSVMLRKGKTHQIEYYLMPFGAIDDVTYSSSNSKIASVSSSGIVTGKASGTANITVTSSNGHKTVLSVTVFTGVYTGVDVSKWQGSIDWKKVSKTGIDFAMIRSSYGSYHVDETLKTNVAGCEKYNIPYGFYHYTYAKSVSEAKTEAKFFLKTIKKYSPEYPIVLDIEESFYSSMTQKQVTDIIVAFMNEIENAGYYGTVYSYANFFTNHTNMNKVKKYNVWVASWGDEDKLNQHYDYQYGMWQYTDKGTLNGIQGDVDLNYAYKDFATIIRDNNLNNLS